MVPRSQNHAYSDGGSVLWVDGDRVFRRGWGPRRAMSCRTRRLVAARSGQGAAGEAATGAVALSDSSGFLISTILSLQTFAVVPRPCQTFLDEKSGSGRSDGR